MTVLQLLMQEFIEGASVTEDADLETVTDRLANCETGAIAVFSGTGQLMGIISDRELVKALSSRGKCNAQLVARDIMSSNVVTCTPEQADIDLLRTMAENGVRHLPVVIGKHVVGMVAMDEVVKMRLTKVGHFAHQTAREPDSEKRLQALDQDVHETAYCFAIFSQMATVVDQVGLEGLSPRAQQMFMEICDRDTRGTPIPLRDLMKFHRWGGPELVRKLVRQLEASGLVQLRPVGEGSSSKLRLITLSEKGRDALNGIASAVKKMREQRSH